MSVSPRKRSPFFWYDFTWQGLRFRGSTKKKTQREAEKFERDKIRALEAGEARKRPRLTFNQAFGRYAEEHAAFHASGDNEEYFMANLSVGLGRDAFLDAVSDSEIATYVARRRAEVANASVNREVELLRRVYRRAERTWKVDVGEMPNWRELLLPEPAERIRELTAAEEEALFDALREDYHPLVRFALATGIRLGNLIRLTWKEVDYGPRVLALKIKGGANQAYPLTAGMVALLAGEKGKHPIYVFVYQCSRSRGKRRRGEYYPFSKHGWRKAWWAALESAKIADFRFHDLRHSFATRTMRATGNLKAVSKLLGHTDIGTTSRYAHVTMDDLRAVLDAKERHTGGTIAESQNANALTDKKKSAS